MGEAGQRGTLSTTVTRPGERDSRPSSTARPLQAATRDPLRRNPRVRTVRNRPPRGEPRGHAPALDLNCYCIQRPDAGVDSVDFTLQKRQPLGVAAICGFWLVDAQNRALQRAFIDRNKAIRENLQTSGLITVLDGGGDVAVLGSPELFQVRDGRSFMAHLREFLRHVLREAVSSPLTFTLYLFLMTSLAVEALFL